MFTFSQKTRTSKKNISNWHRQKFIAFVWILYQIHLLTGLIYVRFWFIFRLNEFFFFDSKINANSSTFLLISNLFKMLSNHWRRLKIYDVSHIMWLIACISIAITGMVCRQITQWDKMAMKLSFANNYLTNFMRTSINVRCETQ